MDLFSHKKVLDNLMAQKQLLWTWPQQSTNMMVKLFDPVIEVRLR
jgi:hypothetical protein